MVGTRSPGQVTAVDRAGMGVAPASSPEAIPGKRTLTMALDAAAPGAAPDSGLAAIAQMGPGRPLDAAAAKAAAAVLGQAPGDVQIHTGPEDERFVAQHGARAVTVGNHIAFGAGQYRPGTPDGDQLIAHELAHGLQTKGADLTGPVGHGSHGAEIEADQAADRIAASQHGDVSSSDDNAPDRAAVSPQPLALHKDDKPAGARPDPTKKAALDLADKIALEV